MAVELKTCFAALPKTERGRPVVLGGDPKGKKFLYCHGTNVIIRDIENPNIVDIYSRHQKEATVAKFSPSGFYIASGDVTGKVHIWDTVNAEHLIKSEFQPISGRVRDISWSPDNSKLALVGMGREQFGACITYDSGNTVGNLICHTKEVNAVTYRPKRPFRIASASEDQSVGFFEGPPFKNKSTFGGHTNFVNAVRYSPNGDVFISGGADGKAFVFDGATGEQKGELGDPAHKGGIYGLDFSDDSSQVLTVSGDKSAKIWDVATSQLVTEFKMGTEVRDMQLGCLWQGCHILTVGLSGFITYLDPNNPNQPIRVIRGHNKPITATCTSRDNSNIYTGTVEGVISCWDAVSGQCEEIKGKGHTNQVQDMVMDEDDMLVSIGLDDTFRETPSHSKEYGTSAVKTDSQPKSLSRLQGLSVIACVKHIMVMQGNKKLSAIGANYDPECISLHPGKTHVAVGGTDTVAVYSLSNGALSQSKLIRLENCNVSDVKYSHDGAMLAAVGSDKFLHMFDVTDDYKELFASQGHAARICSVAWSPDCSHLATSSIDSSIGIWIPVKSLSNKIASVKDAHTKSWGNKVEWLDNNTVISVGQDSSVKQWTVKF